MSSSEGKAGGAVSASGVVYPVTAKKPVKDEYHGTTVTDNYRWLEDPGSAETKAWVASQVRTTDAYVEANCAAKAKIKARQLEMQNYVKFGMPFKRGKRYFFFKNDGLQNHYVLYKQAFLDGKEEVLIDPNKLSDDGTASLGVMKFSESAELLAYGVKRSGSDWTSIRVRRVGDCADLSDELSWVKFSSIAWFYDEGFFYSKYPTPKAYARGEDKDFKRGEETDNLANQALYYHRIGTDQTADVRVFAAEDNPKWMVGGAVTNDNKTLLLSISDSCDPVNRLYFADLGGWTPGEPESKRKKLVICKAVDTFEAGYDYVHNESERFWFRTNRGAPCYKLVSFELKDADAPARWETIVAERKQVVLEDVDCVGGPGGVKFVTCHLEHVKNKIAMVDLEGKVIKDSFELPEVACVSVSSTHKSDEMFFKYYSFLYPGTIMHYSVKTGATTKFKETIIKGYDPSQFVATQVFYKSKDGTRVPMFVVHKRSVRPDTKNPPPTLMYGYGGFNISLKPGFRVSSIVWMQHFDGVYAVPNIRGGGEYGEEWHQAGTKLRKQNVFDDFQWAAKWLIANGYASPARLAISGGSNGGLLTAACANQAPELFGCAVVQVGVLDMLRFHRFTIGYAWCSDYGNADENKDEFEALYKISPAHNVRDNVQYPAVLVTTADHDDRVSPLHSYKFIAALQDKAGPANKKPLLIKIEVKAGHGAGKPLAKQIEESAAIYSFIAKSVGATWSD